VHARLLAWGKHMLHSHFRLKSIRSQHELAVFCDGIRRGIEGRAGTA
jgi:hypothetical protein